MFALHAHLEFVTKYRHAVFTAAHLARIEEIRRTVCADFGCELVECNGEAEHVHLLVHFPPTVALSRPVNALKGVSSRRLRQAFPELARHYLAGKAAVVGVVLRRLGRRASLDVLRAYIEQQRRPRDEISPPA